MNTNTFTSGNASRLTPQPLNQTEIAILTATPGELATGRPCGLQAASGLQSFPNSPELWRMYRQQASLHNENALVECYLPLVNSILNRLAGTLPESVDREDLYSAGLLGLLTALRKFDPATGVPFDSYARQRIRGAMLDEIRRMDWVPRAIRGKSKDFHKIISQLEQQLGRSPTRAEAARAMNLTPAQYDELAEEIRPAQYVRLDSANESDSESDMTLGEIIAEPDGIHPLDHASSSELKQVIFDRLKQMPKIQQQVLTLYFVEGLYLQEIARTLGLTEGRISQIQSQAIKSLRTYLKQYENGLADCHASSAAKPVLNQKRTAQVRDTSRSMGSKSGSVAENTVSMV